MCLVLFCKKYITYNHINGKLNPADCATRGLLPNQLKELKLIEMSNLDKKPYTFLNLTVLSVEINFINNNRSESQS